MALPRTEHEAIQAIADRLTPTVRRAFLQAVARLRGRISVAALARALERGLMTPEIEQAIALWPADLRVALAALTDVVARAGAEAASRLSGSLRLTTAFDLTNPFAVVAAETRTAFLIREITAQQRAAVQSVIQRAFVQGIPPRRAAREIQSLVGLTQRQMWSAMDFQSAAIVDGLSIDRAQVAADRYADRLLRQRAETIARTETVRASVDGQLSLWRQARADGLLGDDARKRWIVTFDDRLCVRCRPLHGIELPLDALFPGGVMGPPLHPNCRCALRLAVGTSQRRAA